MSSNPVKVISSGERHQEAAEWTRSIDIHNDQLRLFQHSNFYDCTFRTFAKTSGEEEDFKCHKVVLSTVCCVFAKMLYGQFKEAQLAPDDPIPLHGVAPETFVSAMRFIYGQQKAEWNLELTMDVYRFAHEMQIPSLLHAANEFFKTFKSMEPSEALKLFSLFILLDNKEGLQMCKKLLQGKNSSAALKSEAWLSVSEAVVQEVLQMDQLDVSESEVVEALLKWGQAQVAADGHDSWDYAKLKNKISSGLKYVRWTQFDNKSSLLNSAKAIWVKF